MRNKNDREAHREALRRTLSGRNADENKENSKPTAHHPVDMGALCKKMAERLKKK